MNPRTVALVDQAGAAAAHSDAILRAVAQRTDSQLNETALLGPITTGIVNRLMARGRAGQLTLCPHLSYTAPAPAFWLAYAAGRLRCVVCAEAPARRIKGTREDHRCDNCSRVSRPARPVAIQVPPVVVQLGEDIRCAPPITVLFGLCRSCWTTDRQEARL